MLGLNVPKFWILIKKMDYCGLSFKIKSSENGPCVRMIKSGETV